MQLPGRSIGGTHTTRSAAVWTVCVRECVFILSVKTAQKDVNDAVTLSCIVCIADFVALIVLFAFN